MSINFFLKIGLGIAIATISVGAWSAPVCSALFLKADRGAAFNQLARLEVLLAQTAGGGPFRERILGQMEEENIDALR